MTEKIDPETKAEIAKTAISAARLTTNWFKAGLADGLSPAVFDRAANAWADRTYCGKVSLKKREGYVLRKRNTASAAVGLLAANHSRLRPTDIPNSKQKLYDLADFLIVTPFVPAAKKDAATARAVALKPLAKLAPGDALQLHCDKLWALRAEHPALYSAFALGDFVTAEPLVEEIAHRDERARVVVIGARQRILWGLWDIHRASAASRDVSYRLVAWFLRLLVRTTTTSAMLDAMLKLSSAAQRVFAAQETAVRHGREKTTLAGPPGPVLGAVIPAASPVELLLSEHQKAELLSVASDIRERVGIEDDKLRMMKMDPDRSPQQTIHEHHFGLDLLAALFMVSYRFAEDEEEMLVVIADPYHPAALFKVAPRAWPREIDAALVARALHLLAAYREATLGDSAGGYDPQTVWDGRPARDRAAQFMARLAAANAVDTDMQHAASMFDLSHHVRNGSSQVS